MCVLERDGVCVTVVGEHHDVAAHAQPDLYYKAAPWDMEKMLDEARAPLAVLAEGLGAWIGDGESCAGRAIEGLVSEVIDPEARVVRLGGPGSRTACNLDPRYVELTADTWALAEDVSAPLLGLFVHLQDTEAGPRALEAPPLQRLLWVRRAEHLLERALDGDVARFGEIILRGCPRTSKLLRGFESRKVAALFESAIAHCRRNGAADRYRRHRRLRDCTEAALELLAPVADVAFVLGVMRTAVAGVTCVVVAGERHAKAVAAVLLGSDWSLVGEACSSGDSVSLGS